MFNFRRRMQKFCKILKFLHCSKIKTFMLVSANYKCSFKIQTVRKKYIYYFALKICEKKKCPTKLLHLLLI